MAFLFQDQNQGIRNDAAHPKVRLVATVLFYPEFNRRLRSCTESADPCFNNKALAGLGLATLTAGGDFHPALRTSAARHGRPAQEYDQTSRRQQAPLAWGIGMSPCRGNRAHAPDRRTALRRPRQLG